MTSAAHRGHENTPLRGPTPVGSLAGKVGC